MKGHRKVAITIWTVLDVSDIPEQELESEPYALGEKVAELIRECNKDYYEFAWEDLGEE